LDLVQVTPTVEGEQPICRILDADRYRFERSKAEREHARRQRELTVDTKEVRMKPSIGQADLALKARHAKAFLEAGDKVKVTMKFKGRERAHKNAGRQVIEQFISQVGEHIIDKPFSDGDGEISIVLGSTISKAEILKKTEKTRENA
jgi:translation initiation factor IF-3